MTEHELIALAFEESQRLIEKYFISYWPYSCWIELDSIPYNDQDHFCDLVEAELLQKGHKITRIGKFFKVNKWNGK